MISKNLFLAASIVLVLSACASNPASTVRKVAGTGDIDSSTTEKFESYSLPITRQGLTTTRVAYNFWSGEWPTPVIDVNSDKSGSTTIQAYKTLRGCLRSIVSSKSVQHELYHCDI